MSESDGPKQVDDPEYHSDNYTAAQTCGWTANSLCDEGNQHSSITAMPLDAIFQHRE